MSLKDKQEIPAGLKNRPGLNGNQRLPSINVLVNRLNCTSSSSAILKTSASPLVSQMTRGGVSKRVFKPNIPVKVDRIKEDNNEPQTEQEIGKANGQNKTNNLKSNDSKKNLKHKKDFIQIEGTFEGFKTESKNKSAYSNGHTSSSGYGYSSTKSTEMGIKNESNRDKRLKTDDVKREKLEKLEIKRAQMGENADYLSDELDEDDLSLDDEEMPISWANYSKMINQLNSLNEEKNNVEEKLENGRLILMPCIFGKLTGDTGYKLQVLKSGRMRLVDKKSGFIIDLLNTGDLEHDAIKEVVELDDDKLLRYGLLKNSDIYSPVRNSKSDYNSIIQD